MIIEDNNCKGKAKGKSSDLILVSTIYQLWWELKRNIYHGPMLAQIKNKGKEVHGSVKMAMAQYSRLFADTYYYYYYYLIKFIVHTEP